MLNVVSLTSSISSDLIEAHIGLRRCFASARGQFVWHDQLLFLGDAFMLGASPGLICSGVAPDVAVSVGRVSGVACSVVVEGMHPGRAGGPSSTSESRVLTAATARSNQVLPLASLASSIVTVAVMPETSGMPGGTLSIAMRIGTRCARRTQV